MFGNSDISFRVFLLAGESRRPCAEHGKEAGPERSGKRQVPERASTTSTTRRHPAYRAQDQGGEPNLAVRPCEGLRRGRERHAHLSVCHSRPAGETTLLLRQWSVHKTPFIRSPPIPGPQVDPYLGPTNSGIHGRSTCRTEQILCSTMSPTGIWPGVEGGVPTLQSLPSSPPAASSWQSWQEM